MLMLVHLQILNNYPMLTIVRYGYVPSIPTLHSSKHQLSEVVFHTFHKITKLTDVLCSQYTSPIQYQSTVKFFQRTPTTSIEQIVFDNRSPHCTQEPHVLCPLLCVSLLLTIRCIYVFSRQSVARTSDVTLGGS